MKKLFSKCLLLLSIALMAKEILSAEVETRDPQGGGADSILSADQRAGVSADKAKRAIFSRTYLHNVVQDSNNAESFFVWHKDSVMPFGEVILSWNASRPSMGKYIFYMRVKDKQWSGWLKYAEWGAKGQQSFSYGKDSVAKLNVCIVSLKGESLATEFEVKVEACGGASLGNVHKLYACVSNLKKYEIAKASPNLESGFIEKVPQQSQMVLSHPRAKDMCSPTATSTVVSYFLGKKVDPLVFSSLVHDDRNDIYGNWVLNVAQAYDISGEKIPCCVARLTGFDELHSYLRRDYPVVVSIRGPIKGGASRYALGHLLVVIGWDAKAKRVLCVDSAFKTNDKTMVWYDSDDFCKAWGLRNNLSYVFMPQF